MKLRTNDGLPHNRAAHYRGRRGPPTCIRTIDYAGNDDMGIDDMPEYAAAREWYRAFIERVGHLRDDWFPKEV